MEIADAQTQLASNPAAGLLARRDIADLATALKQVRPDLSHWADNQVAALEKSLPGKSAARQFVEIDALRAKLGNEMLRAQQDQETALAFIAQREAETKASDRRRQDRDLFVARNTGAAQGVLQMAAHRLTAFISSSLTAVEFPGRSPQRPRRVRRLAQFHQGLICRCHRALYRR